MESYDTLSETILKLFNEIINIEGNAVITEEFKNITNNDMHVIEAIGKNGARNMSSVAKSLSVTMGTLTIAINNLLKKGYVERARSERDRRVVLVSLTDKGRKAFDHHTKFHKDMIRAMLAELKEDQTEILVKALNNLHDFFLTYGKS